MWTKSKIVIERSNMKLTLLLIVAGVSACLGGSLRSYDAYSSWRIIGGRAAEPGEFPYQISLRKGSSHSCGGSIVDKEWVITAAHCVVGSNPSSLTVRVGSAKSNAGGTIYKVLKAIAHPDYDSWDIINDAAILQVEPIELNENVQTIPLEKEEVGGDVPVTLSGWGSTILWGPTPENLQTIDLKTVTNADCQAAHRGSPIVDSEICTYTKSGEGACHGDSGGPLVTGKRSDNSRKLTGIVSWGQPCAKGKPDVFTRVRSFVSWFNEKCNCGL